MKFLLLYPLSSKLEIATCKDLEAGAYLPPLGLLYLGKMLEINGHTVKIIDCNVEGINKNDIKKTIPSYDAVGMTIYSKPRDLNNSINLSTMIKEYDPSIPIIIGGPHCSLLPKLALKDHQADICVIGEGELVITQLADTIEGKRELKTIPGICYKKKQ